MKRNSFGVLGLKGNSIIWEDGPTVIVIPDYIKTQVKVPEASLSYTGQGNKSFLQIYGVC